MQSTALAAVLVSDDFNNAGTLTGMTPDTSVSGNNWFGNTRFVSDGSVLYSSGTSSSGMVSVDLGANYFSNNSGVYALSADVFFPSSASGSSQFFGLGFGSTAVDTTGRTHGSSDTAGTPWMFLRGNGDLEVRSTHTNALYDSTEGAFAAGSTYNLLLQLDTTTPLWTVNAFVNGVQLDLNAGSASMAYTFETNPEDIRYVTLSTTSTLGAGAYMDNFQLQNTVPEPSSFAMAGMAAAALVLRRRKRG